MNTSKTQIELTQQLAKTQFALNTFFTLSLDLLCIYDKDGFFKQLSSSWEKLLGWSEGELNQQPWMQLIHPDDVEITSSAQRRCSQEDFVKYENRYRHKNGSYCWLAWRLSQDEDGVYYGVAQDITAIKQLTTATPLTLTPQISLPTTAEVPNSQLSALSPIVELETFIDDCKTQLNLANQQLHTEIAEHQFTKAALEKTEEHFRSIFDEAHIGMLMQDLDSRLIAVNRALCKMLGYTQYELMCLTFTDLTHPEDLESELFCIEQLRKKEIESFQSEKRYLTKNREIIWAKLTKMLLKDEEGQMHYILGMVEDITQQKKAVEALRQSETRYRAIVEDQTELICRFQPDGTITFVNDAYCRYFNKPRESLIGHKFLPMMPPEDRKLITQNFSLLSLEQPTNTYEHRVILSEGEIRWQQWSDRALFDENNNFIECQAVGRDITQLKQAEADIRMALAKERELSELRSSFVSLVSHEFRTPLTTIQSSTELLEHYNDRLSQQKKQNHFTRIQNAVKRMTQLLEDVLTIGQAEAGQLKFNPEPIDLVGFCSDIVDSMQMIARREHKLNFLAPYKCANTQLDEKLLGHIITNLLSNAIKYSPDGGIVQFEIICSSSAAIFRIQDTGIGIPEEDLDKLFDSFGRASNVGTIQGTGLGLAIVKKCVDLHGGDITVESELGVGTTFTVILPLIR